MEALPTDTVASIGAVPRLHDYESVELVAIQIAEIGGIKPFKVLAGLSFVTATISTWQETGAAAGVTAEKLAAVSPT